MAYFYRRSSGRFYARIRVPETLQSHFRTQELRRSLNTTDRALACHLALAAALQWKAEFARLSGDMDLEKLIAGSPLLLSSGLVKLADAAPEIGLSVPELFDQFKVRKKGLSVQVNGLMGATVQQLSYEDGGPCIDVGESLAGKGLSPIFGVLSLRPESLALTSGEIFSDCVFSDSAGRHVVLDWPGVDVPVGELLATRAECEQVRQRLAAAVTPEMREAARPAPAASHDLLEQIRRDSLGSAYKYLEMRASALLEIMHAEKAKQWRKATAKKNQSMHGMFVELMGDPALKDIDRDLIKSYQSCLMKTPENLSKFRQKHPALTTMDQLLQKAADEGAPLLAPSRVDAYVDSLKVVCGWAFKCGYMRSDPAGGIEPLATASDRGRAQSKRNLFDASALHKIFVADWWRNGKGSLAKSTGRYYHFQPFNYWVPLIALYSGARLNEISQLYLKDISCTPSGCWYLDFNLDGANKIDADQGDADEIAMDKQLKTENAERVVAMHPELVRLGLTQYVLALKAAGHQRLFPELPFNAVKGYGKYAGQWFNERYLGKAVGMVRDGTQTFHSFRHTFITACDRVGMTDHLRNQIAGHSRGDGVAYTTYIKDRPADEQIEVVSKMSFDLPPIAPFDVAEGMMALQHSLERKQSKMAAEDS